MNHSLRYTTFAYLLIIALGLLSPYLIDQNSRYGTSGLLLIPIGIIGLTLTPIARRKGLKAILYPVVAWSITIMVPVIFYVHDYISRSGGQLYVSDGPNVFVYAPLSALLIIVSTILTIIAVVRSKSYHTK